MSISLEIVPITRHLELEGEPDGSSAYSLSGHVSVTLRPSKFQRKTVRYLLQSLVITYEGQNELVTPDTGYTPYRICTVTKELAPQNPLIELNNESSNSGEPCVWNIVFDLVIPGWLPSSTFEDGENAPIAVRYALHATATFINPEEAASTSYLACFASSMARSFFPSLFPSPRTVRAKRCDIEIVRVMKPTDAPIPFVAYTVDSDLTGEDIAGRIPSNILSKIAIMASVPEYVDMESNSFEVRLRIRTCSLDPLHCKRLRLTNFTIDVHQFEKYRTKPSNVYIARFSLPPESSQPPNQPLLISHPLHTLFAIGMLGTCADRRAAIERSFSLLPKGESGEYQLAGEGYIFATDGDPQLEGGPSRPSWYAIDPTVHLSSRGCTVRNEGEPLRDWAGNCILRETGLSPLFTVRHEVRITLFCTYDVEGDPSNRVTARLRFIVPILFSHVSKRSPVPELTPTPSPRSASSCSISTTSSMSSYYAHTLPAYSQLFEPNGDRKIDYSLPSYSQHLESNAIELSTF